MSVLLNVYTSLTNSINLNNVQYVYSPKVKSPKVKNPERFVRMIGRRNKRVTDSAKATRAEKEVSYL